MGIAKRTVFLVLPLLVLLAGCAPHKRPPGVQPTPPGTVPAPTPAPTEPPTVVVEDPTACEPDWPDATGYRFGGRPKKADDPEGVWFFWFSAVVKWPEGCSRYMTDPRQFGTCAYHQEGHPRRADCERKHGVPVLFGAPQREDNPFSADASFGAPVVACLRSSCSDPSRQETCSVCTGATVGQW